MIKLSKLKSGINDPDWSWNRDECCRSRLDRPGTTAGSSLDAAKIWKGKENAYHLEQSAYVIPPCASCQTLFEGWTEGTERVPHSDWHISKMWSSWTENILSRAGHTCTPLNFNGHVSARESLRSGTLGCVKTVHVTLHMQDIRISNRDTKWQPSLWNTMLNKQRHYDFLAANVYRLVCVTKRWFSVCRLKVLHTPVVQTHEAKTNITVYQFK